MRLHQYYHQHFREDLQALFRNVPEHEARIIALGYNWIDGCTFLNRVEPVKRSAFLSCLHFTVLADQAMHAHFLFCYDNFEKLTLYPKFRLGLGHPAYLNPIRIFEDPIRCNLVTESDVRKIIPEGMSLFIAETDDFFKEHMPQIATSEFFNRILADPDVSAGFFDASADSSEKLSLRQFVASELKNAVSQLPGRSV